MIAARYAALGLDVASPQGAGRDVVAIASMGRSSAVAWSSPADDGPTASPLAGGGLVMMRRFDPAPCSSSSGVIASLEHDHVRRTAPIDDIRPAEAAPARDGHVPSMQGRGPGLRAGCPDLSGPARHVSPSR